MNRKQVAYFLAIAEANSLSRASERLRVAQPALSARLAELESSVGVRLFERHPRGVRLTAHGRAFLPHANAIEAAFEAAAEALRSFSAQSHRSISIGVTPAIAVTILPALLDVTSLDGLAIEWNARQAAALPLIDMLASGEIDSALMYHDPKRKDLRSVRLLNDDMVLVGSPSVLGGASRDIRFAEVGGYDLVLDQRNHLLRQVIENAASRVGVRMNVHAEVDPLPAKRRMIDRGCCTIIPRNAFASEIEAGAYVARRIVAPRLTAVLFLLLSRKIDEHRAAMIEEAVRAGLARTPMIAGGARRRSEAMA